MSEEILGRVEVEGGFDNLFILFFTSNRIIVAKLLSGTTIMARNAFLEGGRSITQRELKEKREELGRQSAESILKENEKNFAISRFHILK